MFFHRDRFFNFHCLFCQLFSAAYLLKVFLLLQRVYTALFIRCDHWAYSLVFVQLACWHTNVFRWGSRQPWRLSPFHRRRHCWCAHTCLPANFQCSHRIVLVPFGIICSLHLIAVWFWQSICLPEWSLQLPSFLASSLCLQRTRGSFKYFPKNALLSFCRSMKSAVHVPYAGRLILSCSYLACTHDFKNLVSSIQLFCCKTFTMIWYHASYCCLCVQSSMTSPLHHLSYCHLSVLICLQAPVFLFSCFGTSFSAAPLLTQSLNVKWWSW